MDASTSHVVKNPAKAMFEAWQEVFPNTYGKLDKLTNIQLRTALLTKFSNDISRWKEFLRLAKTCTFLHDKPHLQALNWLLQDRNINVILAGGYGASGKISAQSSNLDQRERENMAEAIKHIKGIYDNHEECLTCIKTRIGVLQNLSSMIYHAWFFKLQMFYEEEDEEVTIIGTNFIVDTTRQRYGEWLKVDKHKEVDVEFFINHAKEY
jgi:hypothetical protein